MHFPWKKKSKVSRISQLVAGIQSPKHKSFVVETGFPTSLIDLFVKNRDRLKNSSSTREPHLGVDDEMEISSPVMVNSGKKCVIGGETVRKRGGEVIGGIQAVELLRNEKKRESEGFDYGLELNCVFVWVLKVFVVVVLGLSARKLAIGITLSACLLMFVEYFGVVCGLKFGLQSVFCRIGLLFVRFRNRRLASKWSDLEKKICAGSELCCSELKSSVGEIEVVENELDRVDQDCVEEGRLGCSGQLLLKECLQFEKKLEDEDDVVEVVDCKSEHKGSGKKKSKLIKKFVQKKLRYRNKKNKGEMLEGASEEQESVRDKDETLSCGRQHPEQDSDKDSLSQASQELKNYTEGSNSKEIIGPAHNSGELFKCEDGISAADENMDRGSKQNTGYLFLFLIVLAGLLGGRVLAFAITMAWFCMQKLLAKSTRFDNGFVKGFRARLEE